VGGALAAALVLAGLAAACKACHRVGHVKRFKKMREEAGFLTAVVMTAASPRSSAERAGAASAYAQQHAAYSVRRVLPRFSSWTRLAACMCMYCLCQTSIC
jgi:hypothetical protein